MTKANLKDYLQYRLEIDYKWAVHALHIVYENQTADEKAVKGVRVRNGKGFAPCDAQILTEIAEKIKQGSLMNKTEARELMARIPVYAGQVLKASNITQLEEICKNDKKYQNQDILDTPEE